MILGTFLHQWFFLLFFPCLQFSQLLSHKLHYSRCFIRSSLLDRRLLISLLSSLKLLNSPTKVSERLTDAALWRYSQWARFLFVFLWVQHLLIQLISSATLKCCCCCFLLLDAEFTRFCFFFLPQTAQQSNQSPMSLTSDASSPRSYVSPRISTPQTNAGPLKPLLSSQPVLSQSKVKTTMTEL